METRVSDHYRDGGHFHDASEHGLAWESLNQMLHLIVCIFILYGMIQLKSVKFIHSSRIFRYITLLVIAHNWYLTIKFALLALVTYLFNETLEAYGSITLADYNCSLGNHLVVIERSKMLKTTMLGTIWNSTDINSSEAISSRDSRLTITNQSSSMMIGTHEISLSNDISDVMIWLKTAFESLSNFDGLLLYAQFLDIFGGPFRLLGNRSTLMLGFYSASLYIMLAMFPIETMYKNIVFNFIRFVLSDPDCMRELYQRRERHLNRLTSWSRNQTNSELTLGTKMTLSQRDLRSRYADDCNWLAVRLVMANMETNDVLFEDLPASLPIDSSKAQGGQANSNDDIHQAIRRAECQCKKLRLLEDNKDAWKPHFATRWFKPKQRSGSMCWSKPEVTKMKTAEYKLATNVKPLRSRLAINHMETPSYQVQVANRNLAKFKPFVRSESWFKLSMLVYPTFVMFYFTLLASSFCAVLAYFVLTLKDMSETCERLVSPTIDLFKDWSFLDQLLYLEIQYLSFALAFASSFYCSYYFGTVVELSIWKKEIEQQLDLCRIIVELSEHAQRNLGVFASLILPGSSHQLASAKYIFSAKRASQLAFRAADKNCRQKFPARFSHLGNGSKASQEQNIAEIENDFDEIVGECFNEFGGIKNFWLNRRYAQSSSQTIRFKTLELMAIKLLHKKQTVLRATYINMNLLFDELNETRFMVTTILRRTTSLGFIFSLLVSATRSQFKANYWHSTFLLAICLVILNSYLACAAAINSSANKLLVQVHSLISASLRISSEDADLFEFWVRHIRSFGEDRDVMSYKIYGYKITWATILNFDSAMCTAYFYTIY